MDTFKTYINTWSDIIGGSIAGLLITASVAAFLLAVTRFIFVRSKGGDGSSLKDARNQLGWSIVGLFVIFSIWGIIAFMQTVLPNGNKTTITAPSVSINNSNSSSNSPSNNSLVKKPNGSNCTQD